MPSTTQQPTIVPGMEELKKAAAQGVLLKLADLNDDGRVTKPEARESMPMLGITLELLAQEMQARAVQVGSNMPGTNPVTSSAPVIAFPESFFLEDRTLIDKEKIESAVRAAMSFPAATRKLKFHLPEGIEKIRLSDMCDNNPFLPCQTLPNGKILVVTKPGPTV